MTPATSLAEVRPGDALLARLRELACVEVEGLLASSAELGPGGERQLLQAFAEDLTDALAEARDACVVLDRTRPPSTRPIDADPLALAEQTPEARRGLTDEDLERLTSGLIEHAHRRRRAAAIELAAAPLLSKLRDVERRLA